MFMVLTLKLFKDAAMGTCNFSHGKIKGMLLFLSAG